MKSKAERLLDLLNEGMIIPTWPPSEFVDKIIALFKKCVPLEFSHNDKNDEAGCNCDWIEGYNDCRYETIKNIEEMGK